MESSVLMSLSKLSFTPLYPMRTVPSSRARPNRRLIMPTSPISQKMYVTEQSYNTEAHKELMEFVDRNSLKDGDKFWTDLMRESPRHKALAMRILEVRSSYCKEDFEWDTLQRLATQLADESNKQVMRAYLLETSNIGKDK